MIVSCVFLDSGGFPGEGFLRGYYLGGFQQKWQIESFENMCAKLSRHFVLQSPLGEGVADVERVAGRNRVVQHTISVVVQPRALLYAFKKFVHIKCT